MSQGWTGVRWFLRRSVWTPVPIVPKVSWPRKPSVSRHPAVNWKKASVPRENVHRWAERELKRVITSGWLSPVWRRISLIQDGDGGESVSAETPPTRRRSIHESLSLPVAISSPVSPSKESVVSSVASSSQSVQKDAQSPTLSTPKDSSPSSFLRNVKKRESKGKGKELKGIV